MAQQNTFKPQVLHPVVTFKNCHIKFELETMFNEPISLLTTSGKALRAPGPHERFSAEVVGVVLKDLYVRGHGVGTTYAATAIYTFENTNVVFRRHTTDPLRFGVKQIISSNDDVAALWDAPIYPGILPSPHKHTSNNDFSIPLVEFKDVVNSFKELKGFEIVSFNTFKHHHHHPQQQFSAQLIRSVTISGPFHRQDRVELKKFYAEEAGVFANTDVSWAWVNSALDDDHIISIAKNGKERAIRWSSSPV